MDWEIAFFIWMKGTRTSGICCIPFLEAGVRAFSMGLMINWIAIPVYAISLWIVKKARVSYKRFMVLILLVPTASSLLTALCFLHLVDTDMISASESMLFWVPLFCCILCVTFSANRIYSFLYGEAVPSEFTIN